MHDAEEHIIKRTGGTTAQMFSFLFTDIRCQGSGVQS